LGGHLCAVARDADQGGVTLDAFEFHRRNKCRDKKCQQKVPTKGFREFDLIRLF
jgi:hypothetical protein